jgi:23S rRNA pseudoU1915 N3-methylase RlmH
MTIVIDAPAKARGFFLAAFKEYEKRLSRRFKFEFGKSGDYSVLLSPKGEPLTSEELAKRIDGIEMKSRRLRISTWPPEREGFDEAWLLSSCDLGPDCQVAAIMEQIYRGTKISGNEPYHK